MSDFMEYMERLNNAAQRASAAGNWGLAESYRKIIELEKSAVIDNMPKPSNKLKEAMITTLWALAAATLFWVLLAFVLIWGSD